MVFYLIRAGRLKCRSNTLSIVDTCGTVTLMVLGQFSDICGPTGQGPKGYGSAATL